MVTLKPVSQQVIVIIGASSGIGRATALRLGKAGAKLVVAARSKPGLDSLVKEISSAGGEATSIQCDITEKEQVQKLAENTLKKFGRIDTWINVAGVAIWSKFEHSNEDDFRKMMDVNVMGVSNSIWTAIPILKKKGGAFIVVSSVASTLSLGLLTGYSATKHAVEGILKGLRAELAAEGAPVVVTSIKPGTIKTPLFDKNKVLSELGPSRYIGTPPFYHPDLVAKSIEYACAHPSREIPVGTATWLISITSQIAPAFVEWNVAMILKMGILKTKEPKPNIDNLNDPAPTQYDTVVGNFHTMGPVFNFSLYNSIVQSTPAVKAALGVAVASLAAYSWYF